MRSASPVQLSGRKSRRPTITGTSREASVTDTSDWQLEVLPSEERDADRMLPFLRQRRVIDDEKASLITDEAARLLQQGRLERDAVPHAGGNEMMKLIIADIASSGGHRLHALAVARADQTGDVERAHPPPRWMRKPRKKRLKPPPQIAPPAFVHHHRR